VIDEPNELPQVRLTTQIEGIRQLTVLVSRLPHQHEENAVREMIDDLLITCEVPLLHGEIFLATGDHDPEGYRAAGELFYLRHPALLLRGEDCSPVRLGGSGWIRSLVSSEPASSRVGRMA
jgi:hypothetical protein